MRRWPTLLIFVSTAITTQKGILKKYFPLQSLYLFGYYAVLFMVVSYNNLLLLFDRSSSS